MEKLDTNTIEAKLLQLPDWDYFDENNIDDYPVGYNLSRWVNNKITDDFYGLTKEQLLEKIRSFNDVWLVDKIEVGEVDTSFAWELEKDNIFDSYYNLYFYMEKKLKSLKAASKFLVELGIDGFKAEGYGVEGVYLDSSDYIVCIINASKLKDVKGRKVTVKDIQKVKDYYR